MKSQSRVKLSILLEKLLDWRLSSVFSRFLAPLFSGAVEDYLLDADPDVKLFEMRTLASVCGSLVFSPGFGYTYLICR